MVTEISTETLKHLRDHIAELRERAKVSAHLADQLEGHLMPTPKETEAPPEHEYKRQVMGRLQRNYDCDYAMIRWVDKHNRNSTVSEMQRSWKAAIEWVKTGQVL